MFKFHKVLVFVICAVFSVLMVENIEAEQCRDFSSDANQVGSPARRDDLGDIIGQFEVGEGLWSGLAWDGELMWGVDYDGARMIGVSPDGEINGELGLEDINEQLGIDGFTGMCWDGEAFWLGSIDSEELYCINRNGDLISRFNIEGEGAGVFGAAWDGENLWYIRGDGDAILRQVTVEGETIREVDCRDIGRHEEGSDYWSIVWVPAHEDGHLWALAGEEEGALWQLNVEGERAEIVQETQIGGEAYPIGHDGSNLWYADCEAGWFILDDGIDEGGGAVDFFETEGAAWSVTVEGDFIYVADGENGVVVLTWDDDGNIVLDNHWAHPDDMEGDALSVVITDNLIYLADGGNGLVVLTEDDDGDIVVDAHWAHPDEVEGETFDLDVAGDLIYLADGQNGVVVLTRDDDGDLVVVNQWGRENEEDNEARDIIAAGDYIYVANGADGLVVLTEDDDGELVVDAEWTRPEEVDGCTDGLALSGDNIYLADEANGVVILNSDDDGNLVEVNHWEQPEDWEGYAIHLTVLGDYIYLADETSGLVVLTEDEDGELVVVERFESDSNINDVVIDDIYAYVAEEGFGIRVYDISEYIPEPAPDIVVSPLELDFGEVEVNMEVVLPIIIRNEGDADLIVQHPLVGGDECFGSDPGEWDEVIIEPDDSFETCALFFPGEVGEFEGTLTITSNDPDEGEVVVALSGIGIEPPSPHIIVTPDTLDFGEVGIDHYLNLLITINNVGNDDLTVSDISTEVDYFSVGFDGEFTLEPDSSREVVVTFAPEEVGEFEGMLTISSDDPDNPEVTVRLIGVGLDLAITGSVNPIPDRFYLSEAYPNPFNAVTKISYGLPVSSHVLLQVFDVKGQLVNTLIDGERHAGSYIICWNGRSNPTGLYYFRMESSDFSSVQKVILMR